MTTQIDPIWEITLVWCTYNETLAIRPFGQEANDIWYSGRSVNAPPRYQI